MWLLLYSCIFKRSNHLHVLLRIDIATANCWSDREVLEQWRKGINVDELTQELTRYCGQLEKRRRRFSSRCQYLRAS